MKRKKVLKWIKIALVMAIMIELISAISGTYALTNDGLIETDQIDEEVEELLEFARSEGEEMYQLVIDESFIEDHHADDEDDETQPDDEAHDGNEYDETYSDVCDEADEESNDSIDDEEYYKGGDYDHIDEEEELECDYYDEDCNEELECDDYDEDCEEEDEAFDIIVTGNVIYIENFAQLDQLVNDEEGVLQELSENLINILQFTEAFHLEAPLDLSGIGGSLLVLRGMPHQTDLTKGPNAVLTVSQPLRTENITFNFDEYTTGGFIAASDQIHVDGNWSFAPAFGVVTSPAVPTFIDNSPGSITFEGSSSVTISAGPLGLVSPNLANHLFVADAVTLTGTMTVNINALSGTQTGSIFATETFSQSANATLNVSAVAGMGEVIRLRGQDANVTIGPGATVNIPTFYGAFLSVDNDQNTGTFLLESGANFTASLAGGLAGNTDDTIGHVVLENNSTFSITGTTGTNPVVNVKYSFTSEGSNLVARGRTGTGAFIRIRSELPVLTIGPYSNMTTPAAQPGPMFHLTGNVTDITIGENAHIQVTSPVFLAIENGAENIGVLTVEQGATIHGTHVNGLTGNAESTIGTIDLASGSTLSVGGVTGANPGINVRDNVITPDLTDGEMPVNLIARNRTGAGAFIRIRTENPHFRLANHNRLTTTASQTGPMLHVTGPNANVTLGNGTYTNVSSTSFLNLENGAASTGTFLLETGATFSGSHTGGFSGNTDSTVAHMYLETGAAFTIGATTGTTPSINVGLSFITADASDDETPVALTGVTRGGTGTTAGAFVRVRQPESVIRFGERTNVNVTGHPGSIVRGTSTTDVTVARGAQIDAVVGLGFTGMYEGGGVIRDMMIEDDVYINLRQNVNHSANVPLFRIGRNFSMPATANLIVRRGTTATNHNIDNPGSLIQGWNANATIQVGSLDMIQNGSVFSGNGNTGQTTDAIVAEGSILYIQSGRSITGGGVGTGAGAMAAILRSLTIEDNVTMSLLNHPSANEDQPRFRLRQAFHMGDNVQISSSRASTHGPTFGTGVGTNNNAQLADDALIQLTQPNSTFIVGSNSEITLNQVGQLLDGVSTTTAIVGSGSVMSINTVQGFTGEREINTLTIQPDAQVNMIEPTTGAFANGSVLIPGIFGLPNTYIERPAAAQEGIRLNHLTLNENARLTSRRGRSNSMGERNALIRLQNANSIVRLEAGSVMDIDQRGGIFRAPNNSNTSLILEEGATFRGVSRMGLTVADDTLGIALRRRGLGRIVVGNNATFLMTDARVNPSNNGVETDTPLMIVRHEISLAEGSRFEAIATTDKPEVIHFRAANAQFNLHSVAYAEIRHPQNVAAGFLGIGAQQQRLIRSNDHTPNGGLRMNYNAHRVEMFYGANTAGNLNRNPNHYWLNIGGTLRINRTGSPTTGGEVRSRHISAQTLYGGTLSQGGGGTRTQFTAALSSGTGGRNQFTRLIFTEAEGLFAVLDQVSDQHEVIRGYMYYDALDATFTFTNADGQTITVTRDGVTATSYHRIIWEDEWVENPRLDVPTHRFFRIELAPGERIPANNQIAVSMRHDVYDDFDKYHTVIKGVAYDGYNFTLSTTVLETASRAELDEILITRARAWGIDVLTRDDLTDDILVVGGTLIEELERSGASQMPDGTYTVIFSVGHLAHEFTVVVDLSRYTNFINVTLPTHMFFNIYEHPDFETPNPNPNPLAFESQEYRIRNNSDIGLDIYVNQFRIDNGEGVHLLAPGENPLDFAEVQADDGYDEPEVGLEHIATPLLDLRLVGGDQSVALYAGRPESFFMNLVPRGMRTMRLEGEFYGPLPGRYCDVMYEIIDEEKVPIEGCYYSYTEPLRPSYRIIFRFVPRGNQD